MRSRVPITVRPDRVCEILSASNAHNDLVRKMRIYQRSGVPHYWVLDPEAETLTVVRWMAEGDLLVQTGELPKQHQGCIQRPEGSSVSCGWDHDVAVGSCVSGEWSAAPGVSACPRAHGWCGGVNAIGACQRSSGRGTKGPLRSCGIPDRTLRLAARFLV